MDQRTPVFQAQKGAYPTIARLQRPPTAHVREKYVTSYIAPRLHGKLSKKL